MPRKRDVFSVVYACELFQIKILRSDGAVGIGDFDLG